MTRRIRWQILIAAVSSLLVLGLMSYLALSTVVASQPLAGGDYVEGLTAVPDAISKEVTFAANGNIEAQGIFLYTVKDGKISLDTATDDL